MLKLLIARNSIKKELRGAEVNIEKALDSKGYDVKATIKYNLTINDDGLNEAVKVNVLDFQNEGEYDEIITEVEKEIEVSDLSSPSNLINDLIKLIEEAR